MGADLRADGRRQRRPRIRGLDVGDQVRVELVHTDVARGFIDFASRAREAMTSVDPGCYPARLQE